MRYIDTDARTNPFCASAQAYMYQKRVKPLNYLDELYKLIPSDRDATAIIQALLYGGSL